MINNRCDKHRIYYAMVFQRNPRRAMKPLADVRVRALRKSKMYGNVPAPSIKIHLTYIRKLIQYKPVEWGTTLDKTQRRRQKGVHSIKLYYTQLHGTVTGRPDNDDSQFPAISHVKDTKRPWPHKNLPSITKHFRPEVRHSGHIKLPSLEKEH